MDKCNSSLVCKVKRIIKRLFIFIIAIVLLFLVAVFSIRGFNSYKTRITSENGVQESTYIELGGIKQYVNIRGEDKSNPVIIFLHGGPGSPMAFISYTYQKDLESDYTIINWDQRGCGRTYCENPNLNVDTELSTDILLDDIDDLVNYASKRFKQEKVIIIGHSWGTILGSRYVMSHPEKVSSYIGVGQAIDFPGGEILAANTAIERAKEKNDNESVNSLSKLIEEFKEAKGTDKLKICLEMRNITAKYLKCDGEKSDVLTNYEGLVSPDMSLRDLKYMFGIGSEEILKLQKPLLAYMLDDFNLNNMEKNYDVPMYYIAGNSDWTTPYTLVEDYYKEVQAPDKGIYIIKNTGHSPFMDNPEEFCKAVRSFLDK